MDWSFDEEMSPEGLQCLGRTAQKSRGFPYHDNTKQPYDKNKIDYDKNW